MQEKQSKTQEQSLMAKKRTNMSQDEKEDENVKSKHFMAKKEQLRHKWKRCNRRINIQLIWHRFGGMLKSKIN